MTRPRRSTEFTTLPDRADGSSSLVHRTLIITGQLGGIPPLTLLPLWALIVVLTGLPWSTLRAPAIMVAALALGLDWAMLALLPRTARSWGPVTPPLLGLALVRLIVFWVIGLATSEPLGLGLAAAFSAGLLGMAVYATWIEPFAVRAPRRPCTSTRGTPAPDCARCTSPTSISSAPHGARPRCWPWWTAISRTCCCSRATT